MEGMCKCSKYKSSSREKRLHDDAAVLASLWSLLRNVVRVLLSHLSQQILEYIRHMPVSFGRRFIEWMIPAIGKVLYVTFLHFPLVDEIKLGADDDDRDVLLAEVSTGAF